MRLCVPLHPTSRRSCSVAHDEPTVVFLDANVLAKPVTRTLILRCSAGGYVARWSRAVEAEANRHLSGRRMSVTELRVSGSARSIDRFKSTPLADRQILADAEVGQATFLVTEDVDDFAPGDLDLAGVTAINPDLFLAERAQRSIYLQALETMVSGMRDPTRTPAELHSAIARQHPACSTASVTSLMSSPSPPGTESLACCSGGQGAFDVRGI